MMDICNFKTQWKRTQQKYFFIVEVTLLSCLIIKKCDVRKHRIFFFHVVHAQLQNDEHQFPSFLDRLNTFTSFLFYFFKPQKNFHFFPFFIFFIFIPRLLQNEHSSNIFFLNFIFFFILIFFMQEKELSLHLSLQITHTRKIFSPFSDNFKASNSIHKFIV